MTPADTGRASARFAEIDTWVFDLDDTLYRHATGMGQQIRDGIRGYLVDFFEVDRDEAARIQRALVERHGTTLQGMIAEHGIAAADFLAFEEDLDYRVLSPDVDLAQAVTALPGRKFVFTNASRVHAERVLHRIGLGSGFEEIYDILAAELVPKPHPPTYRTFVQRMRIDPSRAAMFEDRAENLVAARELGMATVLVGSPESPARLPEGQTCDAVTDSLARFLTGLLPRG